MNKKLQKELQKDFKGICAMVKLGLLTLDQAEKIYEKMSKKYNMTIIMRNRHRDTGEITFKIFEA